MMKKFLVLAYLLASPVWSAEQTTLRGLFEGGAHPIFFSLLQACQMEEVLDRSNITLFLPDEGYLANLEPGDLEALKSDVESLSFILGNHLYGGQHSLASLVEKGQVEADTGLILRIESEEGQTYAGGCLVLQSDLQLDTVTVHTVDGLFLFFPEESDPGEDA